jgi:hypothetical protein
VRRACRRQEEIARHRREQPAVTVVTHDGSRAAHGERDRVRDAASLQWPRGEIARRGLVERSAREHRARVVGVRFQRDGSASAGRDADAAGGYVVHHGVTQ